MMFNSPYSIIEAYYKRREKEVFLERYLNKNERLFYKKIHKIIKILIVINIPIIYIAWKYNFYIWFSPFIAMVLSSISQNYRRIKLNKYGYFNYSTWYYVLFQIVKWIFLILFIFYGSYKAIFFVCSLI